MFAGVGEVLRSPKLVVSVQWELCVVVFTHMLQSYGPEGKYPKIPGFARDSWTVAKPPWGCRNEKLYL